MRPYLLKGHERPLTQVKCVLSAQQMLHMPRYIALHLWLSPPPAPCSHAEACIRSLNVK